jgi:hypothetical protein
VNNLNLENDHIAGSPSLRHTFPMNIKGQLCVILKVTIGFAKTHLKRVKILTQYYNYNRKSMKHDILRTTILQDSLCLHLPCEYQGPAMHSLRVMAKVKVLLKCKKLLKISEAWNLEKLPY